MLDLASPCRPRFQLEPFSLPPTQYPPFPAKITDKNISRKNTLKSQCFSVKNGASPLQQEAIILPSPSLQYPLGNSSDTSSAYYGFDPGLIASHLKNCSTLREVKCVHAAAVKLFDSSETFLVNNLISAYIQFQEILDARKLFDDMPERNVVSWTAILNSYLKLGFDDELLALFKEMIDEDVEANSFTFVCLLKWCGSRLDFELGRQVHACLVKGRLKNLIVDSALLYFYAQCGDLLGASALFSKMASRDVVSWTTMITAYVQHGHGDEAFSTFLAMLYDGLHPNEFTICSLLKACGEAKALQFGKQLHCAIVKGMYEEDVYMGSSLVTMYVRSGDILDARKVFDLMSERNTITWTSMISGYAQCGLGEEAILLFQRMNKRRVLANNLTIVSILSACGLIGSLYLGKEVHGQSIKNCVVENIHVGSTLIWFYCKCGEYAYAAKILEAMPARDAISWTAMISGYTSLGYNEEALESMNDMLSDGVRPNMFTYSSALKACAKLESARYGKRIHASVNKTTALANVFVGSSLIDMYMRCGDVADAERVFHKMPEHNFITWKVMVIGYAKNGFCREALKCMYRMREEGFDVDDFTLTTVLGACGDIEQGSDCTSASCSLSSSLLLSDLEVTGSSGGNSLL